jgi:hypothetical protein
MTRRPLLALAVSVGSLGVIVAVPPAVSAASPSARLVRIDVYRPAPDVAAARGGRPAPTTANCSPDGETYGQYTLTGWQTQMRSATLVTRTVPGTIRIGPASGPTGSASVSDVHAAMQGGFDAWSTGTKAPAIDVVDNPTSTQTKQRADQVDELLFGVVSGNAIAVTYTWRWTTGLIESDTVFSTKVGWAIIPATSTGCATNWPWYDVQNIATHEFGHTYGLGHAQTDRFETMYVYGYTGETLKRTPADGDDAGISDIY